MHNRDISSDRDRDTGKRRERGRGREIEEGGERKGERGKTRDDNRNTEFALRGDQTSKTSSKRPNMKKPLESSRPPTEKNE